MSPSKALPCPGMATRPFSFGHNLNDTVALYSRVQIELVTLADDKAYASMSEAYFHSFVEQTPGGF